ncbi:MAG: FAD-dependent oxidoreductase [Mycobacterium sp.]|nr:FAD-dependent oxidoreductase [Mycobacterium sp.]
MTRLDQVAGCDEAGKARPDHDGVVAFRFAHARNCVTLTEWSDITLPSWLRVSGFAAGRRHEGHAMKDLPDRARAVIVGGGVTGCSIAYHLAHLGWTDVVLLEQHELTAGTTWHAAGLITSAGMTDETALFLSRYSRDLYARLEQETGHSTGFNPVGHISLATNPRRLEALRRSSAWMHGFGVTEHEISARELQDMWPLLETSDVLAGFYVPDEGRADPVGVATSMAKGAKLLGAAVIEGVTVRGVETGRGRVTGVLTDRGRIETEVVVNAAGMWARQLGARNGVTIPLQAAEHYYLITDTVPGMDHDLAVIEDPDRYGYYRPEGDGMLVGLFEPVGAPWSLDGVPEGFAFGTLPPDWDRVGPYLGRALERIPSLSEVGVRLFFCGPESFTPDVRPMLGPAPELDGYYVAAGMNSLGILSGGGVGTVLAHWIVEGVPPVDVTGYAIDRAAGHEASRRFRSERTVEQLGVLFGDAVWPTWKPGSARGVRRSVLHDRLVAAGGHFNASVGWEYAEWYDTDGSHPATTLDYSRQASFDLVAGEHRAVREDVGVLDMSLMAKFLVQGPDAARVLDRLSVSVIDRELGRLVYTQWLYPNGGIAADLTITRLADEKFLVVTSDLIHRRVEPMVRRAARVGETVVVTDITSGTTLLSVQGPKSRTLLSRLTDADLSNEAFPYLSAQHIHVGYAPVLAIRVTYLGELGWEMHIPAEYAAGAFDDLMAAGADLGLRPVGLAAMSSLRLEKGYRDIGVDIDNTDNPIEAGLGFTVAWDKPEGFIGREALLGFTAMGPPRHRVVGLFVDDPGADLFGNEPVLVGGKWVGYLRAAAYGHTLGGPVGLAQVACESGVTTDWLRDTRFTVHTPNGDLPARLQTQPFYDPHRRRILGDSLAATR